MLILHRGRLKGKQDNCAYEKKGTPQVRSNIYVDKGFKNRREYLEHLADDYNVEKLDVFAIAEILGPSEDFDRLLTSLEDIAND